VHSKSLRNSHHRQSSWLWRRCSPRQGQAFPSTSMVTNEVLRTRKCAKGLPQLWPIDSLCHSRQSHRNWLHRFDNLREEPGPAYRPGLWLSPHLVDREPYDIDGLCIPGVFAADISLADGTCSSFGMVSIEDRLKPIPKLLKDERVAPHRSAELLFLSLGSILWGQKARVYERHWRNQ
jgi:hypothetical protein